MEFFHFDLKLYVDDYQLPIYLNIIEPGEHPKYQFHDHNSSEIIIVLDGSAEHIVSHPDQPHKTLKSHLNTGDVLVLHPGPQHAYTNTETLRLCNIIYDQHSLAMPILDGHTLPFFRKIFPEQNIKEKKLSAEPAGRLEKEQLEWLMPQLLELQQLLDNPAPGNTLDVLSLFIRITIKLSKMLSKPDLANPVDRYRIGKAIWRMHTDFAQTLTLDELAASVNMSRRNFCRYFRQITGTSPTQYLMRIRLEHALEMLKDPGKSIVMIALSCGFYDGNYFCKQFRKHMNMSPGAYRRQLLKTSTLAN